ncbi:hypothetical protein CDAR_429471 [Caerostris darwini]|uniref:Uncharacterized protein n=1 Tax=Caerostris darwini TaxID=1538125 RepID=A0AAV4WFA9_9ARAC|nr:hypothetical protein CDAR_429471 [Caerostris darwini]
MLPLTVLLHSSNTSKVFDNVPLSTHCLSTSEQTPHQRQSSRLQQSLLKQRIIKVERDGAEADSQTNRKSIRACITQSPFWVFMSSSMAYQPLALIKRIL